MSSTTKKTKITETFVSKLQPQALRYVVSDTEISGFWLTINPSGRKTFSFRYRVGGGRAATVRQPKIGDWPAMKVEAARKIASQWSAEVRQGGDPGGERQDYRVAPTMSDLFDRYLTDHARPHKKPSSVADDESMIAMYLRPEFGCMKVAEVTRSSIDRFHKSLAGKPYRANRALALLSKVFSLAADWGMRPEHLNPVLRVKKFSEKSRQRFLSGRELARLGEVLRVAERQGFLDMPVREGLREKPTRAPVSASAVAAIKLLIFTGARRGEILTLRWDWIDRDAGRARLPDSKTGEKTIILPPAALAILDSIRRVEGNPHVIAGLKEGAALVNLKDPWIAVREVAGLDDVRIHDLRHSFASVGAAGGASLPIIGALLGHSQPSTTARYAHLADDPLQAAAADIGSRISAAMGGT